MRRRKHFTVFKYVISNMTAASATSPANAAHEFTQFVAIVADVAALAVVISALPQRLEQRLQCFCFAPQYPLVRNTQGDTTPL